MRRWGVVVVLVEVKVEVGVVVAVTVVVVTTTERPRRVSSSPLTAAELCALSIPLGLAGGPPTNGTPTATMADYYRGGVCVYYTAFLLSIIIVVHVHHVRTRGSVLCTRLITLSLSVCPAGVSRRRAASDYYCCVTNVYILYCNSEALTQSFDCFIFIYILYIQLLSIHLYIDVYILYTAPPLKRKLLLFIMNSYWFRRRVISQMYNIILYYIKQYVVCINVFFESTTYCSCAYILYTYHFTP